MKKEYISPVIEVKEFAPANSIMAVKYDVGNEGDAFDTGDASWSDEKDVD